MKPNIICVIMGGGRGTRLYPLTKLRCKPAVPLGGKYRLVDIPISNCINSGYNQIYLLSQFNTASLHRHIQDSYKFDPFGGGFVDILSAEQTEMSNNWYQGTADAVRQNVCHFEFNDDDIFLILSGDQLYRMNFDEIVNHHIELDADVTIASKLIPKENVSDYGVMRVNGSYEISEFVEKPQEVELIDELVIGQELCNDIGDKCRLGHCLASMGIYVFKAKALRLALANPGSDFGKDILPGLLGQMKLCSHVFEGYWEDIGTVRAFFDANMMLTDTVPQFNFFDASNKIYTHARYLPGCKVNSCQANKCVFGDGCIITDAELDRCVFAVRSIVREGSKLENVYMMGADFYEEMGSIDGHSSSSGVPPIGIGKNCTIKNAIIDKNARIGNNVILSPEGKPDNFEQGDIYVRDGLVIVIKDGVVPDNTVF